MNSNFPDDVAKIGYWHSNGLTFNFPGKIDELRIWNRSLSQSEIREGMCKKLTGNEPGLIGYWTFDETSGNTVIDKSVNGFNGQLMNSPTRVFSGASIGDESAYRYTASWSGQEVTIQEGDDAIVVSNVTGNPQGVHTYVVRDLPSQTVGLDLSMVSDPYFGVFVAATDVGNSSDISYTSGGSQSCGLFARSDNSEPNWVSESSPMMDVMDGIEIIKISEVSDLQIDLGEDEEVCPFIPRTLSPLVDPTGFEFTWQDGSKQPTFLATSYGVYWVTVEKDCLIGRDTISFSEQDIVDFPIDLGEDEIVCPFVPKTLSPLDNPSGFEFTWQDGSKQSTFEVDDYGTYWVTISSDCATGRDTISFTKPELSEFIIPNVFTPNDDELNQYFVIDNELLGSRLKVFNRWGRLVHESVNYQNNWDGDDLPPGVYYYLIYGECFEQQKGWVAIIR